MSVLVVLLALLVIVWCAVSVPASVIFGRAIADRTDLGVALELPPLMSDPLTRPAHPAL